MTSLNRLKVDHLVLECSRLETSQLESLKDIRQDLALGIGVIDIKSNLVESADVVAMRIEEAARKLGPERVQWVHPDCGFWMLPRSVADRKMKQLWPEEIFTRVAACADPQIKRACKEQKTRRSAKHNGWCGRRLSRLALRWF